MCGPYQGDIYHLRLAGFKNDLLGVIVVPCLTDDHVVLAGEQGDFLVAIQFFYETHILAVDPHSGSLFCLIVPHKLQFRLNAVLGTCQAATAIIAKRTGKILRLNKFHLQKKLCTSIRIILFAAIG